jgi:hypothetical protein
MPLNNDDAIANRALPGSIDDSSIPHDQGIIRNQRLGRITSGMT